MWVIKSDPIKLPSCLHMNPLTLFTMKANWVLNRLHSLTNLDWEDPMSWKWKFEFLDIETLRKLYTFHPKYYTIKSKITVAEEQGPHFDEENLRSLDLFSAFIAFRLLHDMKMKLISTCLFPLLSQCLELIASDSIPFLSVGNGCCHSRLHKV